MNPTIQQSTNPLAEIIPQTATVPQPISTRNGKVARLPKPIRDRLNQMLQDGVPYLKIIADLGPAAADINEDNISNWKTGGGYQDWLREMRIALRIQSKSELAMAVVDRSGQTTSAGQAVLQIVAANLCEFLAETDPDSLRESLLSDSDKFTRFVNSMVRLAEGSIKCDLHRNHQQERAAEVAKQKNPAERPGISDESLRAAEEKLRLL